MMNTTKCVCDCGETIVDLCADARSPKCPKCDRTYGCTRNTRTEELIVFETAQSKNRRRKKNNPKQTHSKYIRRTRLDLSDVSKRMDAGDTHFLSDGYTIKLSSIRLETLHNSAACTCCGVEGEYWAVESLRATPGQAHINMYARHKNGHEVMICKKSIMTPIGVAPKYVTMCWDCIKKLF